MKFFVLSKGCNYYLLLSNALLMCPKSVQFNLTAANTALILLFGCACFHSCAKYFYFQYRLIFGTLYPAYSSYKAIKNKDIREYVSLFSSIPLF
jgi:hypothetical protein